MLPLCYRSTLIKLLTGELDPQGGQLNRNGRLRMFVIFYARIYFLEYTQTVDHLVDTSHSTMLTRLHPP